MFKKYSWVGERGQRSYMSKSTLHEIPAFSYSPNNKAYFSDFLVLDGKKIAEA